MDIQLEKKIFKKAKHCQMKKNHHSFISGAKYKNTRIVKSSGKIVEQDIYSKILENSLKEFGKIGTKYNKSTIGFCAEVHSVNSVCQTRKIEKFQSIEVGSAIRPRTMQKGKKCAICNKLF